MKKLVLGTLAASCVALVGCGGDDGTSTTDATITANWTFHHALDPAGAASLGCPVGFDTASVYTQPVDPDTVAPNGTLIIDKYTCDDLTGSDTYPPDTYLTWVQIETNGGGTVYAKSASALVDTTGADQDFDADIIDDGGYFFFTWSLVNSQTGAAMTCADAGITSNGSVEAISTSVATPSFFRDDKFTCTDHYGVTDPLPADDYTISIDAEQGGALGNPVNKSGTITAPNGLTDLGHIAVNIDP